jgi:hypothetical protein
VDVALSSDGKYKVSFCLPGKYTLRAFCMDKTGRVVQFGELEIEVEPDAGDRRER